MLLVQCREPALSEATKLMKCLKFYATATLACASLAAALTSANELANPGFENPVTTDGPPFVGSWEAFSTGPGSEAVNSSIIPRTGSQHLMLSIVNTDMSFAGVFQDVLGLTPGDSVGFRMWHKSATAPLDLGVEVRIEWRNSISQTEVNRITSTPIPTSLYTLFTLSAAAPVGADSARLVYAVQTFGSEPTNTGTVFVDDTSFTVGTPIPGDFDFDDDVDVTDYLTFTTHHFTDVSGLSTEQAYASGDMTADLKIDGYDFVAFRTAYDDANGLGAFVAMLTAVPEPSSWLLALGGLAALYFRSRERWYRG